MASADADLVQTALDAARSGDLGPLVELLDRTWSGGALAGAVCGGGARPADMGRKRPGRSSSTEWRSSVTEL